MKNKIPLILLIALILILSGVFLYYKLAFECGDMVCELHELRYCKKDCRTECSYSKYESLITPNTRQLVKDTVRSECSINWDELYVMSRVRAGISDGYVLRTKTYDYDEQSLQDVITNLKSRNINSAENVAETIGDYVYDNIEYNNEAEYLDCMVSLASDVHKRKEGVCSTMAKVDIALLRGMGIASRPVVGCVKKENYKCIPLRYQDLTPQAIISEKIRTPKTQQIKIEDNKAVSAGGIHTWAEVWLPDKGWVILEPTTGYLMPENCEDYMILKIDPTLDEFCGLNNLEYGNFIKECEEF